MKFSVKLEEIDGYQLLKLRCEKYFNFNSLSSVILTFELFGYKALEDDEDVFGEIFYEYSRIAANYRIFNKFTRNLIEMDITKIEK